MQVPDYKHGPNQITSTRTNVDAGKAMKQMMVDVDAAKVKLEQNSI